MSELETLLLCASSLNPLYPLLGHIWSRLVDAGHRPELSCGRFPHTVYRNALQDAARLIASVTGDTAAPGAPGAPAATPPGGSPAPLDLTREIPPAPEKYTAATTTVDAKGEQVPVDPGTDGKEPNKPKTLYERLRDNIPEDVPDCECLRGGKRVVFRVSDLSA